MIVYFAFLTGLVCARLVCFGVDCCWLLFCLGTVWLCLLLGLLNVGGVVFRFIVVLKLLCYLFSVDWLMLTDCIDWLDLLCLVSWFVVDCWRFVCFILFTLVGLLLVWVCCLVFVCFWFLKFVFVWLDYVFICVMLFFTSGVGCYFVFWFCMKMCGVVGSVSLLLVSFVCVLYDYCLFVGLRFGLWFVWRCYCCL